MKKQIIEKFYNQNGNILKGNSQDLSFEKVDNIVYEVIRVIDGIPLFLEEHIERLNKSANLLNYDITDILDTITKDIKKVIDLNNNPNKNLKILLYNIEKPVPNYYIFFIESNYPANELYQTGIKTITYKAIRENPQAKTINKKFRKNVNIEISKNNAYEALLINELGEISEGSRSNVFFVKNDSIYTAPGKNVLLGTTRKKIIKICDELNFEVNEKPITIEFLKTCDALFITGTSPKVLPISQVDEITFDSPNNKVVQRIMKTYDSLINDYINIHK